MLRVGYRIRLLIGEGPGPGGRRYGGDRFDVASALALA